MGQPITVLGKLGDSVLFSGMSSIQEDDVQTRNVTLRAMHFVALLTIPLASALVLQAEGVTWLFLGDRFASAAPVVQILFAAVVFRALTKLGDANLRALDGLNMGIAIKLIFSSPSASACSSRWTMAMASSVQPGRLSWLRPFNGR